jgi:ankyrin repeat protein
MSSIEELSQQLTKAFPKDLARFSSEELNAINSQIAEYVGILVNLESEDEVKQALVNSTFGESKINFLHIISKFGYDVEVDDILKFVNDENYVNVRDANLFTPLHYAARNGCLNLVKIFLANGADVNSRTSKQTREWTPLHHAARGGHLEIVAELLNFGVDREVKTGFGLNALHVACEYNHSDLVRFLLEVGLDYNAKTIDDNHQMTCLHYAAINGNDEIIYDLLKAGADGDVMMTNGYSVLEIAAKNNCLNAVLELLKWGCKDPEYAFEVAKEFKALEVEKEIGLYEKTKKNLFKNLNYFAPNLLKVLKEFDESNLSEGKEIEKGFILNAYGIFALESEVGLFKKTRITLEEFAQKKALAGLLEELTRVKSLIKKS